MRKYKAVVEEMLGETEKSLPCMLVWDSFKSHVIASIREKQSTIITTSVWLIIDF